MFQWIKFLPCELNLPCERNLDPQTYIKKKERNWVSFGGISVSPVWEAKMGNGERD